MSQTTTLRDLVGLGHTPSRLSESALVLIDCQNTYRTGLMQLTGVEAAIGQAQALLKLARQHQIPVIHIQHDGGAGSPYDLDTDLGAISSEVAPTDDEMVIVKQYPNSFIETSLDQKLKQLGVKNLILAGFMTHMCVNSTAHGAFNLGYHNTIVASATATRPLAGPDGQLLSAQQVQAGALAGTRDLYAAVVNTLDELPV
ncbi:cysteine hydrolase family protein [Methylophaga lonarensis]|uniref:cysteine hydrolase family protein n=1 Tax=Methylophaga lonarensis TaxID=999151 RepID=UPI003D2C09F8